ncbi:MAG: hypothetical protein OES39_07910 [Desulfobulbaceae bacterium]|nr:hypothetical protein [Desulfobulbaceae bacterium]
MRIKIFLIFALLLASVAACALSSNFTDLTTEEVKKGLINRERC